MAGAMYRRSAIGSSKSVFLKVHARDPFNQGMILFVKMQSMDPQVSVSRFSPVAWPSHFGSRLRS